MERRIIKTLKDVIYTTGRRFFGKPALQERQACGYKKITYQELLQNSRLLSTRIIKLGLEKADHAVVICENRPEWAIIFFAVTCAGGVVVPLDIKYTETELERLIIHAEAKIIFVSQEKFPQINKLKEKIPSIREIITITEERIEKNTPCLKELFEQSGEYIERDVYPDDVALMVYTSGTTGLVKAAQLTHANLVFQIWTIDKILNFSARDRFLSILPLNHVFEITGGLLAPLLGGATVTYMPNALKSEALIGAMKEIKATVILTVPLVLRTIYERMLKRINKLPFVQKQFFYIMLNISRVFRMFGIRLGKLLFYDLHCQIGGHFRAFISGAAPLDPAIIHGLDLLGVCVLQGYGLTETAPVITVNTFLSNRIGSAGRAIPGVEVEVVPLYGHKGGEIITRGPHVMKGYFKNHQLTQEVIKDGWFYTGDIGQIDWAGYLYISGRVKNLIVTGVGKKVHPEEVEEEILKSAYVKEICVMGKIADSGRQRGSEEVYAVIVPNMDNFKEKNMDMESANIRKVIAEEVKKHCQYLAMYKRIKEFSILFQELPKTATRKIKRKEVVEMIKNMERAHNDK